MRRSSTMEPNSGTWVSNSPFDRRFNVCEICSIDCTSVRARRMAKIRVAARNGTKTKPACKRHSGHAIIAPPAAPATNASHTSSESLVTTDLICSRPLSWRLRLSDFRNDPDRCRLRQDADGAWPCDRPQQPIDIDDEGDAAVGAHRRPGYAGHRPEQPSQRLDHGLSLAVNGVHAQPQQPRSVANHHDLPAGP